MYADTQERTCCFSCGEAAEGKKGGRAADSMDAFVVPLWQRVLLARCEDTIPARVHLTVIRLQQERHTGLECSYRCLHYIHTMSS